MALKCDVPLEEALNIAGCGSYTYRLMVLAGLVDFAAFCGILLMSVVIPAASCDLDLTTYQKGALNSMVYTGMLFSSHLWGFLADTYGRRRIMMASCFGTTMVSLLSSLAPNADFLMISTFVFGWLLAGIFTPIYVYLGECCPQGSRAKALLICCALGSLATTYLPGTAWIILPLDIHVPVFHTGIVFTSWRLFIALLAVPLSVGFCILLTLPETPKYLLCKGMHKETLKLLRIIYAKNHGKKEGEFPVQSVCLDRSDSDQAEVDTKNSSAIVSFCKMMVGQTKMIFTPPLLKYAVLSCLLNVGVVGGYNSVILWFPEMVNKLLFYANFHGSSKATLCDAMKDINMNGEGNQQDPCKIKDDFFIVNICNGLLQSIFYYFLSLISVRLSQKHLIVGLSAIATILAAMVALLNDVVFILIALGALLLILLMMFSVYISIILEFFPTSLRTNATSIILLCGRIAAVLGAQTIGVLYDSYCGLVYPGLTGLLLGMTALFIFLPASRKL